jgi:hypothetical protein
MGMYDTIRSSYDLGPQFTDVELQTKDIEEGYGGTMTDYWLDPEGYLWYGDYTGTSSMEIYEEGHPKYNPDKKFMNFDWIPTGVRGKYKVHPITKYINVYPTNWKGQWEDWPTLKLHFKYGKLIDYENLTGQR